MASTVNKRFGQKVAYNIAAVTTDSAPIAKETVAGITITADNANTKQATLAGAAATLKAAIAAIKKGDFAIVGTGMFEIASVNDVGLIAFSGTYNGGAVVAAAFDWVKGPKHVGYPDQFSLDCAEAFTVEGQAIPAGHRNFAPSNFQMPMPVLVVGGATAAVFVSDALI